MHRKKKNVNEDRQLCLKKEHLLEIELLRMKAEERMRYAQKCHLEAEKIETNAVLSARAQRHEALLAEKAVNDYKNEQKDLFNRLNKVYGVDFRKSTYDDITGIITVVEDDAHKENKA